MHTVSADVAVVTDSTAYLPADVAARHGITVVPLHVVVGGRSGEEGVDVTPADVAAALAGRRSVVTTSRPAPGVFVAAYRQALETGARSVLSVHLSSKLSGTWQSAALAAEECGGASLVRVADSRTTAMGLGFAVLAAAECAAQGGDLQAAYQAAVDSAARTTTLFYVDTLEHLRKGGRIGAARALLGTALSVKPILHVLDGEIVLRERVRTAGRGLTRLTELAADVSGDSIVDIAVHHLAAPERAETLSARIRDRVPGVRTLLTSEIGAAVGAHTGPGLVGVVVRTAGERA